MADKVYLNGDSLLKATIPDRQLRYHFRIDQLMQRHRRYPPDHAGL